MPHKTSYLFWYCFIIFPMHRHKYYINSTFNNFITSQSYVFLKFAIIFFPVSYANRYIIIIYIVFRKLKLVIFNIKTHNWVRYYIYIFSYSNRIKKYFWFFISKRYIIYFVEKSTYDFSIIFFLYRTYTLSINKNRFFSKFSKPYYSCIVKYWSWACHILK